MKLTEEEENEILTMLAEEAEESIRLYGTRPIEEFFKWLDELEETERRKKQLKRRNIKLNMIKPLKMIQKKFIRI